MRTVSMSELSSRQVTAAKAASITTAVGLSGLLLFKASALTTVIAGPTAIAGAISTSSIATSSGTVVLSVVKASLVSKVLFGLAGVFLATFAGVCIYVACDKAFAKWNARDKAKIGEASKSLAAA